MTQEDKQLLLKDLSARLFCGVKYTIYDDKTGNTAETLLDIRTSIENEIEIDLHSIEDVKLYLRSMSSMTAEEKEVLERLSNCFVQTRVLERDRDGKIKKQISYLDNEIREIDLFGDSDGQYLHINQQNFIDTSDFFNSRHIDYRGLIEKGLALEAPDGMYKTE